jgi:hypothetical protein
MSIIQEKISAFLNRQADIFKKPLEKVINNMIDKCRYINGESLERHDWGSKPMKLNHIPNNMKSPTFNADLMNALNQNEADKIDKSIIELLWGDIQLGKRVQSCIIMWFSIHILRRPVLYVFRNLSIDQQQLQDDICGSDKYNFNIQFIKSIFEEFNPDIQECLGELSDDYWMDYKLPEMKEVAGKNIDKLWSKNGMNNTDIFCCLMNNTQLEKIDDKFSEYIHNNHALVNMTIMVDESDLTSPTASNDGSRKSDISDITYSEQLIAKIYKKSKYVLLITGTAHSLLYNISTILPGNIVIETAVSKVHKMVRTSDYYGLFNDAITFNTQCVAWWETEPDLGDCDTTENNPNSKYDIIKDYDFNIREVITHISQRNTTRYNSLLISEEKIKKNQFMLVDVILRDFPDLFVIVYHGECLRLHISKKYESEIIKWSVWESERHYSGKRLNRTGGVYGISLNIDLNTGKTLPNDYCYFDIDTSVFNIKMVYKLLRMMFDNSSVPIDSKTVITITGKYGERGYSFTSDDYGDNTFHLTDQYFVSHSSFNCSDISQRLRLQGKYNDIDLENGTSELTLWTTPELKNVVDLFYLKFIRRIEASIMGCRSWKDIKAYIESIFDNGDLQFGDYMKYIDVSRKRKNIKVVNMYESNCKGYNLSQFDGKSDVEITRLCIENKFPEFICINEIKTVIKESYTETNIFKTSGIPIKISLENIDDITYAKFGKITKSNRAEFITLMARNILPKFMNTSCKFKVNMGGDINMSEIKRIQKCILDKTPKQPSHMEYDININIIDVDNISINCKKGDCFITYYTGENEARRDNNIHLNPVKNTHIFTTEGNLIKYSSVLTKYIRGFKNDSTNDFIRDALPNNYYWRTPDNHIYLFSKNAKELALKLNSLSVVSPSHLQKYSYPEDNIKPRTERISSMYGSVVSFIEIRCSDTENARLRFGICEIYCAYKEWCGINGKKPELRKKFKSDFERLRCPVSVDSGVSINNRSGKRGYNVMIYL